MGIIRDGLIEEHKQLTALKAECMEVAEELDSSLSEVEELLTAVGVAVITHYWRTKQTKDEGTNK